MGIELSPEVAERLGPFYVYALVDPRDDQVFYVGKGTGARLLAHGREADLTVNDSPRSTKIQRIKAIRAAGLEPRHDVVRHGLSEREAFLVEAAIIDTISGVTNAVSGHGIDAGRLPLEEYAVIYGATPLPRAAPPAVLIRLKPWEVLDGEEIEPGYYRYGSGFRSGMSTTELLDSTRAWWRISPESAAHRGVQHAVAVHAGTTRAVMTIDTWLHRDDGRCAWTGSLVPSGPVHDAWVGPLGRRVNFTANAQNPITYWPPG